MKQKWSRRGIAYSVIAVVVFLLLFVVTFFNREEKTHQEYEIVVLGDSIFGDWRGESSISDLLGERLGVNVFNGAMGGTCMSRWDATDRMGYTKDMLSVVSLAEAIGADDFRPQQTVRIKENATEYFGETIDAMELIDFDKVDTILICAGVNDYHTGIPIDSEQNPYDRYTFVGALRSSIRDIRKAYPNTRIVLVTATYAWYRINGLTCEEYNCGGGFLEEYVNAEIALAEELDVDIIDLYHDFYEHNEWQDWETYTTDGVHPNELGRSMIAEKVAVYLEKED